MTAVTSSPRTISGVTPSGPISLGNYLGAIRRWTDPAYAGSLFFVSNLHAMTLEHDPQRVTELTREAFLVLIAAGIDPDRTAVFVQADVAALHCELSYLLECTATFGEMRRMIQFKEKSAGQESVRLSLLTYPALMAADILLYQAQDVPVAEDQSQHVELARTLARRFNQRYGETFVVPRAVLPTAAARVLDLADPSIKMSKSNRDQGGVVAVLDDADTIRAKLRRAVTDTDGEVRPDPQRKPGVSNLLEILAAATDSTPEKAADGIASYAELKATTADAVIAMLEPMQRRYRELAAEPATVDTLRRRGAHQARELGEPTLRRARLAIGAG